MAQATEAVVAIDLGTSRSAWAFSIQGLAEGTINIHIPVGSEPSASSQKTETAVLLSADTHEVLAFGSDAFGRYLEELEESEGSNGGLGTDVRARPSFSKSGNGSTLPVGNSLLFRWFKMELCRQGGFQTINDPVAIAEGGQTLPLLVVVVAVLRFFKEDVLSRLSDTAIVNYSVEDVLWVVTIPAIYDDFARRFMREAAHQAGLIATVDSPRLRLCLEPEAACLAVSVKDAPDMSQPGTQTMILDCGGGTVDITTHEVLSVNPLRLKELCPPNGGPWGSTYVDSEFTEWCKIFLGDETFTRMCRTSAFLDVLVQWEGQKTKFGGTADEIVKINMSGFIQTEEDKPVFNVDKLQELRVAYNNTHKDKSGWQVRGQKFSVVLPSPLVRSLFAPTIDKISACLDGLKNNSSLRGLKYVFLVGGFSSSPLVQAAARTSLEGDRCRVITTLRPETAIAKGAVLFANSAKVFNTRKARLTYGVKTSVPFNRDDPEHRSRENTAAVEKSAKGPSRVYRFSRHLEYGDDIPLDGSCRKQCYRPGVPAQTEVTVEIWASHKRGIRFVDADLAFPLGEVTVPLDMEKTFQARAVEVQFVFGGTEFAVNCFRQATGETIGTAKLKIHQET